MSTCPCCSHTLLRHIRHGSIYWFCQTCWQDMPNADSISASIHHRHHLERLLQLHHLGLPQTRKLVGTA